VDATAGLRECAVGDDACRQLVAARLDAVEAAAAELERLRHDLVSTVNHELRTPLSNILGYCELIGDQPGLDASIRSMVEVIDRNSQRLVALISDLLLLADLDAGATVGTWQCVDMAEVVSSVGERITPMAERIGLSVSVDVALPGPEVVGDRDQLERAVHHLAANAVKFAVGGRWVLLRTAAGPDGVVVEVSDDGQGIDPGELPHLLTRFARAERARNDQVQGAGIGLAVVQSVAKHHGGHLVLDSFPGRGTTARLVLPERSSLAPDLSTSCR
jgi:signal transduction histidine kinase